MRGYRLAASLLVAIAFGMAVSCPSLAEVGDVVMKRGAAEGDEVPVSYFPHWIHRMQYKCSACHDELFKMKAGAAADITMDSFLEGKACGACHDGKKAFESNFDTCPRCHRQQ